MAENIYGGPFPWLNLFGGVSGIGGGMSEEDIAWQAYLDYSGLPQAGATGADYLGSFLPEIDLSDLPPEVAEALTPGTPPDNTVIEEITATGEPPFGHNILNAYDTISGILGVGGDPTNPDAIKDAVEIIDPNSPIIGALENIDDYTPVINDAGDYIGETYDDVSDYIGETIGGLTADQIAGLAGEELGTGLPAGDLPIEGDPVDEQPSILDLLGWPYGDVSVPSDEDVVNETINDLLVGNDLPEGDPVDDEEEEDYFILPGDQPSGVSPGEGIIDDTPYDASDLIDTEVDTEVDTEADADVGEGGGIKDKLKEMYDKLGIGGILSILGLLGFGGSKGSSASQGGIGSFASSQFDPSGLGATADYANMPGGGVGQPTWLPNTNAPIYYPFASEVTKQYNAQQGGPFSFTVAPPPDAMIQNLTSQKIPGVTYVADGAFMRRNGLTEGPGTETSDDIPAMLSDGEFVTNAEANRGIGAMALLNQGMPMEEAMNPEQQRLAGARQMYLQQAMGQQLAKQMRNS